MPRNPPRSKPVPGIAPTLAAAAILFLGLALRAQERPHQSPAQASPPSSAKPGSDHHEYEPFCVLPESYDMHPDVFVLVPGARRVGFSLFRETSLGLEPYSRSELRDRQLSWAACFLKGREAATRQLQTLEPKFFRNELKVIQYAQFSSESQLTASIFISPEFMKRFENSLGKELYVAIPDRSNVFVFPKLSNSIEALAPKMAVLYKEALYPVCREVFELSKDGIRVVGKF
jgi:hypothetical protein